MVAATAPPDRTAAVSRQRPVSAAGSICRGSSTGRSRAQVSSARRGSLMRLTVVLGLTLCAVFQAGIAEAKSGTLDEPVLVDAPVTEEPTVVESDSPETGPTDAEAPPTDAEANPTTDPGARSEPTRPAGQERGKRTGQADQPTAVEPAPTEPPTDPGPALAGDAGPEVPPAKIHDTASNGGRATTTGPILGIAEQANYIQRTGTGVDPVPLEGATGPFAVVLQSRSGDAVSRDRAGPAVPVPSPLEVPGPSGGPTGAAGSSGAGGVAPVFGAVIAFALSLVIALGAVLAPLLTRLRPLAIVEPSTRPG